MNKRNAALALVLCALPIPASADIVSGYVNADGTVRLKSSLYTVSHPDRGKYIITFATPLSPMASCLVTPMRLAGFDGAYLEVKFLQETKNQCVIRFQTINNHGADVDFSFIAVPMSN